MVQMVRAVLRDASVLGICNKYYDRSNIKSVRFDTHHGLSAKALASAETGESVLANVSGFTLIEILVAIVLIGIMATFIAPNLSKRVAHYERGQFIARLNALTGLAWRNALATHKIHRVVIDSTKKTMRVEMQRPESEGSKEGNFMPLKNMYIKSMSTFGDNIEIRNFYIEGDDQIAKHRGGGKKSSHESWFFVMPDGLAQAVILNIQDTKDRDVSGRPHEVGLVLNPFTAQFKEYDAFQKP